MPSLLSIFGRRGDTNAERPLPDSLTLTASLDIEAREGSTKPPTFKLVAYSGRPIQVDGFHSPVLVVLSGARFAQEKTPVILDHDTALRVGHTTRQTIDAKGIRAEGVVSSSMGVAEGFVKDAKAGFPFQVSIGASIEKAVFVPEGESVKANGAEHSGPLIVAQETTISELSVTVLGADSSTSIHIAATKRKGTNAMPPTTAEIQADRRATADEELRVDAIRDFAASKRGTTFSTEPVAGVRTLPELKAHAIAEGWPSSEFELMVIRAGRPTPSAGIQYDGRESTLRGDPSKVIQACLMTRAGHATLAEETLGEHVMEASNPYRSASLVDLARLALQASGREVPIGRSAMLKAAISTNTMTDALSGGLDKIVGVAFMKSPATWRSFCAVRNLSNFRQHTVVSPEHRGELEQLGPTGDIKSGHLSDDTSNLKLDTYAKNIGLSRTDWVNDDLSIFDDITAVFVVQAMRRLNNLVWQTVMENGGSHYSAGNANLITDALDLTALGVAVQTMRKQTDADDNDIDAVPRVLVVPPELEITARSILDSVEINKTGDNSPTGNPLRSVSTLEVESRLSNQAKFANALLTHWFLMGGPEAAPVYVGFLDGRQAPIVDMFGLDADPSNLSIQFRVYLDMGVALGEHRTSVRSIGDDS